jgi:coiled-coil domain-containing protein 130
MMMVDKEVKEKLESDPMYRLEHGIEDKKKIEESIPRISQLQNLNESLWADPYSRSQQLRKQFRQEKKNDKRLLEETEKVRDKHSLQIELLPEAPSDVIEAKSVHYNASHLLDKKRIGTAVSPLFKHHQSEDNQITDLGHIAKIHTRLKTDPFYNPNPFSSSINQKQVPESNTKKLTDVHVVKPIKKKKKLNDEKDTASTVALVSYTDSDTE